MTTIQYSQLILGSFCLVIAFTLRYVVPVLGLTGKPGVKFISIISAWIGEAFLVFAVIEFLRAAGLFQC